MKLTAKCYSYCLRGEKTAQKMLGIDIKFCEATSRPLFYLFHKEDYFSNTLSVSLGIENVRSFQKPEEVIEIIDKKPTHILICEDRPETLSEILGRILVRLTELPIIVILTLTSISKLEKDIRPYFPEFGSCMSSNLFRHCQLPCSIEAIKGQFSPREREIQQREEDVLKRVATWFEERHDVELRHGIRESHCCLPHTEWGNSLR